MTTNFLFENESVAVASPEGDYILAMPRRPGTVAIFNLGSVIHWVIDGRLLPYKYNRGNGRVSKKTMESAYEGVKGDSLGECTIGPIEVDGETKMVLSDFHSRLSGFIKRYKEGRMTARELKTPISVRVVTDHLESYQSLNAGDPHRTKDKIKNPDLAYGAIVERIRQGVGQDCMDLIGENKWTILSSILYNLWQSKDRDWNWPKVYQKRGIAMVEANSKAGTIIIRPTDERKLIAAIEYWFQLMMALKERGDQTGVEVSKIIHNAGMFGFIVCDRMRAEPQFSTPVIMIRKIIRQITKVLGACPELCRGNRDRVVECSLSLSEIFKKKKAELEDDE